MKTLLVVFLLTAASLAARIAPTEMQNDGKILRGLVHDPTARYMGGVAGHAGLFSTGDDLAKFAQALLNGGDGILSTMSVERIQAFGMFGAPGNKDAGLPLDPPYPEMVVPSASG